MIKLYRSPEYPTHWFAFCSANRWVRFPAESGGWERRQTVGHRDIETIAMSQVPLRLGFNTGIPGALSFSGSAVAVRMTDAA